MIKKVGIIINPKKKKSALVLKNIVAYLKKKNIPFLTDKKISRAGVVAETDLVIVLGGDGTLLNIAKFVNNNDKIILGVNLGALGFLTEVTTTEVIKTIDAVLQGKCRVTERMMLDVQLLRNNKTINRFIGLNDAVIAKGAISRILNLRLEINSEAITTYACDGLIVSTSTGSTAHALASGGPIVESTLASIIICPICPHTLSNRPLIIAPDSQLAVVVDPDSESEDLTLTVDGQVWSRLLPKDRIYIKRAKHNIKIVNSISKSYFKILREKLGWGG